MNTVIFLPAGGSRRLRRALIGALNIRPGHRALELGCGTGQVTAELVDAGAEVVAVDALPAMIEAARQRAPRATYLEGDAIEADLGDNYDRVVLSFLLHNFDAAGRRRLLRRSALALAPDGSIGILEWALPSGRLRARLWRRFLNMLEPSHTVPELLDRGLDEDIVAAGLAIDARMHAAGGRAQILILSRTV